MAHKVTEWRRGRPACFFGIFPDWAWDGEKFIRVWPWDTVWKREIILGYGPPSPYSLDQYSVTDPPSYRNDRYLRDPSPRREVKSG